MHIEIDDKSGFCFGVVRAISEAEKALAETGTVFSLGDIVHNRIEVQRLERLGLRSLTHADIPAAAGHRLLIRAHGEPPTTYAAAERLGIRIIDATCPVVARLQARVVQAHEEMRARGGQVVILGKRGHAEVVGLTGQVTAPTIVVEDENDLSQIDFARPIHFLSQTTQSIALFERLGAEMRRRAADPAAVRIDDTICRQVSGREQHLAAFAARFDVVILRTQVVERQGAFRSVPESQSPHLQHRRSRRTATRMVCRRFVGRHLRRHLDARLADAGSGRRHPEKMKKQACLLRHSDAKSVRTAAGTNAGHELSGTCRKTATESTINRKNRHPRAPTTCRDAKRQTRQTEPDGLFTKKTKTNYKTGSTMYMLRSLKYFIAMLLLCAALMALMFLSGTSALTPEETLYVMFRSTRFLSLFIALVVLAALYPRFGFVCREIEGDVELNRTQIVNAFKSAGFSLHSESDGVLRFRADGFLHRLLLLYEDEIAVSQHGERIRLDGIRRGVARVAYRLDSYIRTINRNE